MSTSIRSSAHSIKRANIGKLKQLTAFLREYDRVKWWFVDYLWENRIIWGNNQILDVKSRKLNVPGFISTTEIDVNTNLSARAIKSASGEAIGIVKSQTEKRRKQLYILSKKMREGDVAGIKKLQSKIDSTPLVKPRKAGKSLWANLDSNCCTFIKTDSAFNGFLKLHALGKEFGTFHLPVKFTAHSNKFKEQNFELMASWQIGTSDVKSRWKKEIAPNKTNSRIIGADQGFTTCLSLSDGQTTDKCLHGHDLASIIASMNRKKPGSKAFARAQEHRTNYINWSINQLNLDDVKELRLEKLFQMRKGQKTSAALNRWTYTQINAQVMNRCDMLGVRVVEQSATYRSQRCSECGWVHKSNRKGKEFTCKQCGVILDADVNGALNHEADLYRLPAGFWRLQMNRIGFYWLETGIFDVVGGEITVPHEEKLKA